ncbi:hypothetical protein FQA39_LY09909 [Lamprigera yunnana]|nr:hypothetical protein FQA39_LY09909 [Lamprigera yunnana]
MDVFVLLFGIRRRKPSVYWEMDVELEKVPELRLLYPNGTLVFPPFPNEQYRHDIHAALYRCRLRSTLGSVLSREVHVKAGFMNVRNRYNQNNVHILLRIRKIYSPSKSKFLAYEAKL